MGTRKMHEMRLFHFLEIKLVSSLSEQSKPLHANTIAEAQAMIPLDVTSAETQAMIPWDVTATEAQVMIPGYLTSWTQHKGLKMWPRGSREHNTKVWTTWPRESREHNTKV